MLRLQQLLNAMTDEQKMELATRQAQRSNDPMRQAFNTMNRIQREMADAQQDNQVVDESSSEDTVKCKL